VRESLERALSKESPASNAKRLRPTLLTCEPVLTEAAFLLKCDDRDADALFEREVVMRADAAVDHGHADPVPFHPDCISSSPPVRPSGLTGEAIGLNPAERDAGHQQADTDDQCR